MLTTYFRYGWRNLLKNKSYSLINITGLAIGLACCLGIGLFIKDEYSFDQFHPDIDHTYRIVEKQKQAGVMYNVASTPGPMGPAMKVDLPEVLETCRLGMTVGILEAGDISVEPKDIRYVDNSFFSMFNFKLIVGNAAMALLKADEVVLSSSVATELFGTNWRSRSDLLGSPVSITSWGDERLLTVVGVVEDNPVNSHIRYSVLLSMLHEEKDPSFIWDNNSYMTYVKLDPAADPELFDKKLRRYLDKYSDYNSKDDGRTLWLQPMKDVYLHSKFDFGTDDSMTSDVVYVKIFSTVGVIVLLIAIFNFVNLSTARATHRAKEVGVRKVIGALYKQLVVQFLAESFLITAIAMVFATALLQTFLPLLNDISGKALVVPFESLPFLVLVTGATLLISLIAGLYPAFYLSKFAPAKVLKGFLKMNSGITFRRALVVGQFTFSVVLVLSSIVIYQQLQFIQEKNLGFDKSQLIYVQLKNNLRGMGMSFKDQLMNQAGISSVAPTSNDLLDNTSSTWSFKWEGMDPEDNMLITQMSVDHEFIPTLGMTVAAGRNFITGKGDTSSYILNETAALRMGWTAEEAIGKTVTIWETTGTVTGVVKDFHFRPMTAAIEPLIFRNWTSSRYSGVFVKTHPGQTREALSTIEKAYKLKETKTEFTYKFLDEALEAQYRTQENTGNIVLFFSILAILVSCLGLFGLATYAAEQRTKEIGIRKVLGASVSAIVQLLSRDFVALVVVSIAIAAPVAWWSMNKWLQEFAYKINIEWWMFGAAGATALLIALLTVSYHSIKAAMRNPVDSLRAE